MRPFVIAGGVAAFVAATPAIAADVPLKPAPAPVLDPWTGFYLGLNAGYGWGKADLNTVVTGGFGPPNQALVSSLDTLRLSPHGFTGGAQAGYNYRVGNIVYGAELDFDYFGLKDSSAGSFTFVGGGTFTLNNSVRTDWLFTARPRVGIATDRWLPYVTGGVAVTNIKYSSSLTDLVFGTSQSSSINHAKAGWTVGAGIEYALAQRTSVKIEYLYADFGSVSMNSVGGNGALFNQSASLKTNIVRGGVNFKY